MFWLYNTLTFWAAIVVIAYLLLSRSIFLFILITLFLFGTFYMLLVAIFIWTLALQYIFYLPTVGSLSYHHPSVANYCLSTVLALVVLYRISYYMLYRLVPKKNSSSSYKSTSLLLFLF
ncbi:hypothetical protein Gotur_029045 [Gossypium turneri]